MDNVNSPPHYNQSGIECIDAIRAALGPDGFKSYCHGNAQKYLWRHKYKGKPVEDLDKALWYITRLRNEILKEISKDEDAHDI
tara:strand:- start:7069 stop:7317 length:249 start_codon:yes stop_codon:yes gene_type:complete